MKLRLPHAASMLDDPATWIDVHVCDSQDAAHLREPRCATQLLHWVTGPVEYCGPCAAQMLAVAEALGVTVHVEDIALPQPPIDRRGIALGGV